jgi:hypothetical protein
MDIEALCPYCGEIVAISVDPDGGEVQTFVEDCPLCCRPWTVRAVRDERGDITVALERQDD